MAFFAVILGCAVYIAREDRDAARQNNTAIPAGLNKNHPQESLIDAEWNAPIWYGFLRWPYGTTAWAIILTLFAIADQSEQTKKAAAAGQVAAEATRDSIRLQEALNRQWVEITGWRKEGFDPPGTDPPRFTISAEIRNPTQAPVTIRAVQIGMVGKLPIKYEFNTVLAPRGDSLEITCYGTVEAIAREFYDAGNFILVVQVTVNFIDCFEKERPQPFRRACLIGPRDQFRSVPMPELPTIAEKHNPQNPN